MSFGLAGSRVPLALLACGAVLAMTAFETTPATWQSASRPRSNRICRRPVAYESLEVPDKLPQRLRLPLETYSLVLLDNRR